MIPTRLRLSHFLCYREPVDIDFRGIRLACLSGENGAGKSALLDAMTWALWGKARGKSDLNLVSIGGREMSVEFSFLLNGQEYRVVRRRSLAAQGKAGRLLLELHVRDGEGWRVLTGDSVAHTQAVIDRILGIDYETFINSAFILQNRADEFTTKQPAERKRVLAEILNLREYDEYCELAREEYRRCQVELEAIERNLQAIARSLEGLPALEAEVAEQRSWVQALHLQLDELRRRWVQVVGNLELLAASERSAEQIARQIERLHSHIQERERQQAELQRRLLTYDEVLARAQEIAARYEHWQQVRRASDEMHQRLRERQTLLLTAHQLEESILREVHQVERQLHACAQQIETCERVLARLPKLKGERDRLQEQIASDSDLDGKIEECQRKLQDRQHLRGELQADCRRLKEQMQELKRKIDQLDTLDPICPLCLRPLAEHERSRLKAEIETMGRALGDEFRAKRAEIERLDTEREELESRLRSLHRSREQREQRRQQLAQLDAQLADLAGRQAELEQLHARHRELADALERGLPGARFRPELERVHQQLNALLYDEEEAKRLHQELQQLAGAEQEYQALHQASLAASHARQQLAALDEQLASDRAELGQLQHQLETLRRAIAQAAPLREERDRLQDKLAATEHALHEAQAALGRAEQRLEDMYAMRDSVPELERTRGRLLDEKRLYEELVTAFGTNGIPVLIIENIVPELEERANAILDRMPGNALRLEFRTQRQKASGGGMLETLDILISDEAGRRPYELFSGGERFRIDFAIRVALSMLLAHRAGTRLELLVIDEGFGTQDAKGREGIVQAIRTVEDQFAMILVITHIDELKEQFPTRIEVVKAPQGSSVLVT